MAEYENKQFYLFLDWRPMSVNFGAPQTAYTKYTQFSKIVPDTRAGNGDLYFDTSVYDIVVYDNGFFIYSLAISYDTRPPELDELYIIGSSAAHQIKSTKLGHTHHFHNTGTSQEFSTPILLETDRGISTHEDARKEINKFRDDPNILKRRHALRSASKRRMIALEFLCHKFSEVNEKVHNEHKQRLSSGLLSSRGSKILSRYAYGSIVTLVVYVALAVIFRDLYQSMYSKFIIPLKFNTMTYNIRVLDVVNVLAVLINVFFFTLVFLRSQLNTQILKNSLMARGYLERLSSGLTAASKMIFDKSNEGSLTLGIDQIIEYEREKGGKYKMQAGLYIATLALMLTIIRLMILITD